MSTAKLKQQILKNRQYINDRIGAKEKEWLEAISLMETSIKTFTKRLDTAEDLLRKLSKRVRLAHGKADDIQRTMDNLGASLDGLKLDFGGHLESHTREKVYKP